MKQRWFAHQKMSVLKETLTGIEEAMDHFCRLSRPFSHTSPFQDVKMKKEIVSWIAARLGVTVYIDAVRRGARQPFSKPDSMQQEYSAQPPPGPTSNYGS